MSEFERAKNIAIRYIGISKKTIYETKEKLFKKNFSDEIVNKVIEYLKELNYLNDKEYVILYIRQNINIEKYSIFEIKQKLRQKGIDYKNYEKEFNLLIDINYNFKVSSKIYKNKIKVLDEIKVKQYLFRRGFDIREE